MAFKLNHVTVTHLTGNEVISVKISDIEKHAEVVVQIKPGKPYEQLSLGEALALAIQEANKLTHC